MDAKVVLAVTVLLAAGGPQESERTPRAPADARPLPPVQEPFRTEVERADLLQRFGPSSPIEGLYELVSATGLPDPSPRGFLAVYRRHLSLCLQAATAGAPVLQASVRRYSAVGNRLQMTTLVGFRAESGTVYVEPKGFSQVCDYRLIGTKLALHLPRGQVLDFQRVE